jgi:hypothetical protein
VERISFYSNLSIQTVQLFYNDKSPVRRSRNDEPIGKRWIPLSLAPVDHTNEDSRMQNAEDANESDGSSADDDDDQKPARGELDDYVKPSFWLFIEKTRNSSSMEDILEVKFYLYCG